MKFNFNDVIGVKFQKSDNRIDAINYTLSNVKEIESEIEFDDLIHLMEKVESCGLAISLHREAWEGRDYLGKPLDVDTYLVWTKNVIYRYRFPPSWIPLSAEKLNRDRIVKIDVFIVDKMNQIISEN
jgi:hypothetical protein